MGASIKTGLAGHSRRRGRKRHAAMSEINVTPFVDVMLVLLIVFMVAAPMLVQGVPMDYTESEGGKAIATNNDPLTVSIKAGGEIFIGEAPIAFDELLAKVKAIAASRKDLDTQVIIAAEPGTNFASVLKVLGRMTDAGYKKLALRNVPPKGK
jgi:biopolymer transport protein TolR